MEIVLITGISGSGASYLAEFILSNQPGIKVWGISRWHSTTSLSNIIEIKDRIEIRECDLLDLSSIIRVLKECKPTKIFHLAAHANVRACFDIPLAVLQNNIISTANLFEAARLVSPEAKIMMCSTSEVYGDPQEIPIKETHPLMPVNPYSVSKLVGDRLAYVYFKSWKMPIITSRAFTYINPRRKELFSTAFAIQVARIEAGKQKILRHGNLDSIRSIMDIRDMCAAYWDLMDKGEAGEVYNLGGGIIKSVEEFLDVLKSFAKIPIISELDPALLRPVDVTKQIPDITKFNKATNFKPRYSFDESIQFLLDYCRRSEST